MANYKRIFLDGYSYYITIVTYNRNPILLYNISLLRESFLYAKTKFDFAINDIVILPDHIHMIITLENAKEYPKIISCFKRYFSQKCHTKYTQHIRQSHSRLKHGYNAVWQKRYYEHTIRNIKDYEEKQHYIYNNPIKHGYVNNIQEWKYSSLRP